MADRFGPRVTVQKRDVTGIRNPLDPHLVRLAGCELQIEIVIPRIPILSPAIKNLAAVNEQLEIA